jgi:hypothetical protein
LTQCAVRIRELEEIIDNEPTKGKVTGTFNLLRRLGPWNNSVVLNDFLLLLQSPARDGPSSAMALPPGCHFTVTHLMSCEYNWGMGTGWL